MKNPKRVFKGRVYEQLARIGKSVASPQRLELLVDLLGQGPRTVENLAQEAHLTVANTSRHLQVLQGLVTVLDVRPTEEYRAGHIAGVISLPLHQLKDRLAELPRDQDIVAYCRGPYCMLAAQAVELLREQGFRVVRLEDGVADWRAHGLPVSVSDKAS